MKLINFSITESTGRTFELSVEKAKEIIETMKANEPECCGSIEVDYDNCTDIANILSTYCLDDLCKYERNNCYYETTVVDEKFIGSGDK